MSTMTILEHGRSARVSRRDWLRTLGAASVAVPFGGLLSTTPAFAQGRCMLTPGTPACNTGPIPALFEPTGWTTTALDHITFHVVDYKKEAAFYAALMGWTVREDDGKRAVMDVEDWGSVVFEQAAADTFTQPTRGRNRRPRRASVESFAFAIADWDRARVETALTKRGLHPVAVNGPDGYESFQVKDPDGFDLRITNGATAAKRRTASAARLDAPAPFETTGWKTVWLDHLSFSVTDYKKTAAFYTNLLGWAPTYDEGSQNELLIGEVGDIIVRGGNPLDPAFGSADNRRTGASIDHISFGISPWDTDGVKAALESRGLRARIDTSNKHQAPDGTWVPDEIHTAAFKSYHTETPNGYNLQISYVTHDNRLALSNAVRPRKASGGGRK